MGGTERTRGRGRPAALAGLVSLALSVGMVGALPAYAAPSPSASGSSNASGSKAAPSASGTPNAGRSTPQTPTTPTTPPQRPLTEKEKAEDAALAEAKRTGKPVPVAAATTETDTVVANPDGTLGLTRSVAPVRTRKGGAWTDLDATLTVSSDGQLRPKATTSGLTLSGGGNAPLATLDQDGKKLELTWPESLPKPVLDGAGATYPEVAPGTDLKVTADASGGISQILVVKSAEAARHPKLAKLTMGLKGDGVNVSADGGGNLKAADASGRTVFHAPVPTMWDSGAEAAVPASPAAAPPSSPGWPAPPRRSRPTRPPRPSRPPTATVPARTPRSPSCGPNSARAPWP